MSILKIDKTWIPQQVVRTEIIMINSDSRLHVENSGLSEMRISLKSCWQLSKQEAIFFTRKSNPKKQNGASIVEFFIVTPLLLLIGLGIIQIGLLYHAKTTLNYATFEAARAGAVNHAQVEPMMGELAYRLAPVYGGKGSEESAGGAIARAMADTANPMYGNITVLNPTAEMFDAWEMPDNETGELQIPNHHIRHQNAEIVRAGVNIQDANLLKIKSKYGYKLEVPLVGPLIAQALLVMNPADALYYQSGRIPLVSVATVRMQNEARRSQAVVTENGSSAGSSPEFVDDAAIINPGDTDSTVAQSSCDEFGLGDVNDDLNSLLNPDGDSEDQEPPQQCEVGSLASTFDGLDGQNPLSSGLNPCS